MARAKDVTRITVLVDTIKMQSQKRVSIEIYSGIRPHYPGLQKVFRRAQALSRDRR